MAKKIKNKNAFEQALLSWQAPEYPHHEKSALWFVVFWVFIGLLSVYGVASGSATFAAALLVFAGTYYLLHREKPADVTVKVSAVGLKIGRHSFPYSHLKNFWIVYEPPFVSRLYLRMASRFKPDFYVSLEEADVAAVRHALTMHLPELSGKHEPVSDALVRLFRL